MNVAINNRFGILLAEKRVQEKRNIPLSEVAHETGIPYKTLYGWQNNTVTRFDVHVINAICKYFGVKPGELFDYVPDEEEPAQTKKPAR
ncbi:MAG: helix-turn-helix domain-containing protein [Chloroflexota bacterium]